MIKFLILVFTSISFAEPPPYWEVGGGLGYVNFLHYPASDQSDNLFLPFPTFQYRGSILRADDQDGAHIYLFRSDKWTLEFSGTGYMARDSDENTARQNMADLPFIGAAGPQMVYKWNSNLEFALGLYQTMSATQNFHKVRFPGQILEIQFVHKFEKEISSNIFEGYTYFSRTGFTSRFATNDFHSVYYDVPAANATPERPQYESKAGFLSTELSYFQSLKKNKWGYYFGATYSNYALSSNRGSPLHKSDHGIT